MELKDILTKRRSVRKFNDKPVEVEKLQRVVERTLTAPSSRNSRSTRLWITQDKALLEHISEMRDYGAAFVKGASAAVLVMGDTSVTNLWKVNCSISATVLQLSIVEHGLASCWVHVDGRPRLQNEPEGEMAEDYLRSFLCIPENCKIECVIALGYSAFEPKPLPEWDSESTILWHTKRD